MSSFILTTVVVSLSVSSAFLLPGADVSIQRPFSPLRSAVSRNHDGVLVKELDCELTKSTQIKAQAVAEDKKELVTRNLPRIRFKGLTTTRQKRQKIAEFDPKSSNRKTTASRGKSATMPGFSAETIALRDYKERLRAAERLTGRKHKESPKEVQKRKVSSAMKLYSNSANVPASLIQFWKDIGGYERLTPEDERILGTAVQHAIRLEKVLERLEAELGREPTDKEWCEASGMESIASIREDIESGVQAKNRLVLANIGLVQKVVNTYIRNGLTAQYNAADMVQQGILGLIRAAEKYEPDRGWRFSTYSMYWIRSAVKEAQVIQSRLISLPMKLRSQCDRLAREEKKLLRLLGKQPTVHQLSKVSGLSERQIARCSKALRVQCYSLDEPLKSTRASGERSKVSLAEIIDGQMDDEDCAKHARKILREDLIKAMKEHLSQEEVDLLLLRYGMKGKSARTGGGASLSELGAVYGYSVQKTYETIRKCLAKLRSIGYDNWVDLL